VIHEALVLAAAAGNFVFKHFFQKPSLNSWKFSILRILGIFKNNIISFYVKNILTKKG
jgi:hypothetical protein